MTPEQILVANQIEVARLRKGGRWAGSHSGQELTWRLAVPFNLPLTTVSMLTDQSTRTVMAKCRAWSTRRLGTAAKATLTALRDEWGDWVHQRTLDEITGDVLPSVEELLADIAA